MDTNKTSRLIVSASAYADFDDALSEAAHEMKEDLDLAGWDVRARWLDESRDEIVMSLPNWIKSMPRLASRYRARFEAAAS